MCLMMAVMCDSVWSCMVFSTDIVFFYCSMTACCTLQQTLQRGLLESRYFKILILVEGCALSQDKTKGGRTK